MGWIRKKQMLYQITLANAIYGFATFYTYEGTNASWQTYGFALLFGMILLIGATIDKQYFILPDEGFFALIVFGLLRMKWSGVDFLHSFLVAGGAVAFFIFLRIASRGGLGMGDIKWVGAISLWLTDETLLIALWCSFLLGALYAISKGWNVCQSQPLYLPFGPFLAVGSLISYLWGPIICSFYLEYMWNFL